MGIDTLLVNLSTKGVRLWLKGERRRYQGTREVLTPELLDQLAQNKAALIAHLRETGPFDPTAAAIPPAPRETGVALSPYQESLWLLDQIQGGNPCDHIAKAFRIGGALNLEALEYGFNEIVERHEILRTTISSIRSIPNQEIHSSGAVQIEHSDLRAIKAASREAEARRICAEEALRRENAGAIIPH